jgi:hypothetical protein
MDQSLRETLCIVTEVGRRYTSMPRSPLPEVSEPVDTAARDATLARVRHNLDEFDRRFKRLLKRTRRR